ncbi:MAG TPA: OST-HTH/LOTUS domain-containing protein [Roseateles sp.]|uniref:OST-HTH/LOTUS domain-containing protein n=1 Tax=Roseateles sp. TaxID=1971397 RepID=UPI002ED8053D
MEQTSDGGPPQLQEQVERLIGRCMLQLQQYELLVKAMLARHELAGTVDSLEAKLSARVEAHANMTLGGLKTALFESYVVADGFERDLLPDATTPIDRISVAFSSRVAMEPERLAETRAALEALVVMRNDLVHHFVDRFDLSSDGGRRLAVQHLETCAQQIESHHQQLRTWARSMDSARALAASFMQTDVFENLLINGIAPDGSFEWPSSGIVCVLREAIQRTSTGGWARLDQARAWIESSHPEQTPQKYGCRSWPQVLSDSRLFDIQHRVGEEGRKMAWFRERPTRYRTT